MGIQFLADSIPGTGYYWEFSDGTTSTDVNPVHVFENYGYYCVKLTVNNACGSDTFHLPKPVYVNLSSCACDASDGGWYDYDYRDGYTINSYNVETWSVVGSNHRIFVEGDIIIEPYAQLIIDDSVIVEFAPNGRIIVQAGGKLTIGSNVLLTGIYFAPWTSSKDAPWCAGNMWQGIEVWGNNDDPHVENEQGIVEILNEENVTIENAHIGILSGARNMKYLCDNTEPLFDSEKGCGLVRINSKTHFIDDGIGIKLLSREPLYNIGGYWSGNVIQNCNFETTNELLRDTEYLATHANAYPNAQNPWTGYANNGQRTDIGIWMNNIKGLEINSCNFNNLQYGIESFDAKYNVYNSNFTNAYFGIKISNTLSAVDNRHEISACTFDRIPGEVGIKGAHIYIKGGMYDNIHDNTFGNIFTSQELNGEGVLTFEASGFNIIENSFYSLKYGVRIINSGTVGGYVGAGLSALHPDWTGNYYQQCDKNIETIGSNPNLQLKCNMCNNNDPSYYTINFESYQQLANQGSMPPFFAPQWYKERFGAGNEFTGGAPNPKRISSMSVPYNYFHHTLPSTTIPDTIGSPATITIHSIGVPKTNNQTACPPALSIAPNPPNPLPVSLSSRTFTIIDSLADVIAVLQVELSNVELSLDNGKTDELLNNIYGSMSNGKLKNKLVANSPLSDTVIIAMLTEYPLSHGSFKNVMQINMPVNNKVVPYLMERLNIIPQGIANQLRPLQAYNPDVVTTASLQNEINSTNLERQLYLNELIMRLTDTINNRKADAITLLENEDNVASKQILTATDIADGNYADAATKLANIPVDIPEIYDWVQLNQILLSIYQQGKTLYDLDSMDIAFIRELAYTCPSSLGTANAQSILLLLFNEEVPECLQGETRSLQLNGNKQEFKTGAYLDDNYPDPFSNITFVHYYVPEGQQGTIIVNDMFGRKMAKYKAAAGDNVIKIDAHNWNSGVYNFGLVVNGKTIEFRKMVLIK